MKKHLYRYMAGIVLRFLVIVSALLCLNAYADSPYVDGNRKTYIASVLQAFNSTGLQTVHNAYRYINVVDKNNCRSSLSDLRVECLLSYADKNCAELGGANKENCRYYTDIIVVNKLSESTFIDRSERYRILKNAERDHRKVLEHRLQQKYARIVARFSLTEGGDCSKEDFDCLAKSLDQFCLDYTNSQSLSWQYCVSASLWFIGTSMGK